MVPMNRKAVMPKVVSEATAVDASMVFDPGPERNLPDAFGPNVSRILLNGAEGFRKALDLLPKKADGAKAEFLQHYQRYRELVGDGTDPIPKPTLEGHSVMVKAAVAFCETVNLLPERKRDKFTLAYLDFHNLVGHDEEDHADMLGPAWE